MLIVIAVSQIKPGKMGQALEAVQAFMPKVRTEPGMLEYTVYRGVGDANMLAFYEQWEDQDALAAHGSSEEMKAFQQAILPCIDGQGIMGVVEEVASTHQ
jgi:quinol monooxygenase YgiN